MRSIQRTPTAFALALAITLSLGSVAAVSQTSEGALLDRIGAGDQDARVELAKFYTQREQRDAAIEQLQQAAATGNPEAHGLLALELTRDAGRDAWDRAMEHARFALAAGQGASVRTRMGIVASVRAIDPALPVDARERYAGEAITLLSTDAVEGGVDAKWHLGYLLVHGPAPGHDAEKGFALILNAADSGHVVAARWTSHMYDQIATTGHVPAGLTIPALDVRAYALEQSLAYLKQAAAAGNPLAVRELAARYEAGSVPGGRPDPERAARIETANADLSGASSSLISALSRGTVLASASSDAPVPTDTSLLARITERDRTIRQLTGELSTANAEIARLQQELDALGKYREFIQDADELNRRGLAFYAEGDYESALPLFRKAAEANHGGAIANLAIMHLNGSAVPQDVRQAEALLKRAAEQGNLIAAENLAELYESGAGVGRNPAMAIRWYWRAEALGSAKAGPALKRLGAGPNPNH